MPNPDGSPTAEELAAQFQATYGSPIGPSMALPQGSPVPAPVSPPAAMIGGGGAELPPGSVPPPGAPQGPQSAIGFQPPAAPVAAGPAVGSDEWKRATIEKNIANIPMDNAESAYIQTLQSTAGGGGAGSGIAFLPTQTQQVSQTKMSPKAEAALKKFEAYSNASARAGVERGEMEAQQLRAAQTQVEADAELQQQKNAEITAAMEERDLHVGRVMADVDAKRQAWASASQEEFKDKRSGFSKTMGALAAAMGAFGASLTHSENFAQRILDSQFERSYDEWKRGIAAKRDDLTVSQQILNETNAMFKDKVAGKMAAKALIQEQHAINMEKVSYLNRDEIQRAQTVENALKLQASAQATIAEAYGREGITVGTGTSTAPVSLGGKGGGEKPRTALDDTKDRMGYIKAANEALTSKVPGEDFVERNKVKESVIKTMPLLRNTQKLMDMIDEMGVGGRSIKDIQQQFDAIVGFAAGKVIEADSGLGATDNEYLRRMKAMIADGSWSGDKMKAAALAYAEQVAAYNQVRINSLNPNLVDETWQMITNSLGKDEGTALREGRVPTRKASKQSAEAAGMKNVR